ncbi:lipoamide acyltransferase component of branched-chain alpha-keto acid dehydrogenase complex, putative [Plasmodium vinckei vinckei]|uniref:Dihydrolipoamide acetyltransferase component of pyruvate dehydrogenase complex n=1 Tax=Plasmodium vinckei vinckei TaxID=54757 RepID=A0A081IBS6_PLAVN|nr:lipoamide acyltransferase component of branched-chain alpha-keto acid dehydrogenase complex, putative [Plasmodium vinckei vinckei]KEG01134.1 2-oxoisovalerate dehydrogenase E2 component (dihydrolipoyl transacylase) [Plasmodium vinckei vinckei]VEV54935.1 lipoamide acyltransferase component of branched-chain alpha-keto acid dehydrogenase complex, putative [Plasmodium vinckei vinckei]
MMMQHCKKILREINSRNKINLGNSQRFINTSKPNLKIVRCKLFDIGEGISEVEITQWNKQEGDEVSEMESLLTVQSDKAAVDITSKYSGILVKKYANDKDMIKIGSYFCEIDTQDDVGEEEGEEVNEVKEEDGVDLENEGNFEKKASPTNVKASPGTKKKAQEYNLDINMIAKYFNKNNITIEDVELYHKVNKNVNEKMDIKDEVEIKGIKLAMCKSMSDSLSVPLFHLNEVYNVEKVVKIRKELKNKIAESDSGVNNITISSILIKLISNVLKEFPILNSKFNAKTNTYVVYNNHNICVAMDTSHGLLVPNIKNVEKKSIIDIQKDLTNLRNKAMEMKLSKDEIENGTITISNYGAIGGTFATPIIFDNQGCIIGISKIQNMISLKNGVNKISSLDDLEIANNMNLTYGADHRYIDGATLAQFSKKLKSVIENIDTIDPFSI